MDENVNQQGGPAEAAATNEASLAPLPTSKEGARNQSHGEPPYVPRREELMGQLSKMPGLIALGVLTPPKANAMRGVYGTLLANLDSAVPGAASSITDENLLTILRQAPELLKFLEPFLSRDQIQLIVEQSSQ